VHRPLRLADEHCSELPDELVDPDEEPPDDDPPDEDPPDEDPPDEDPPDEDPPLLLPGVLSLLHAASIEEAAARARKRRMEGFMGEFP
jgi:hypothetical protein